MEILKEETVWITLTGTDNLIVGDTFKLTGTNWGTHFRHGEHVITNVEIMSGGKRHYYFALNEHEGNVHYLRQEDFKTKEYEVQKKVIRSYIEKIEPYYIDLDL